MWLRDGRAEDDEVGERLRVPWWLALAALPLIFAASQLLGLLAQTTAASVLMAAGVPKPTPEHPAAVLSAMATGSLLLCACAIVVPRMLELSPARLYRAWLAPAPVFVAASVGTFALGPLADALMVAMAEHFPQATFDAIPRLHELARGMSFVLLWPFFALLPGLSEELFFRGFIQSAFGRPSVAIGVSAVSFAVFHFDPHHAVGVFPLGLFLAWSAHRYGVLVAAVAHIVNNTVALATLKVAELDVGYGSDTVMPAWWVLVGLLVSLTCLGVLATYPASRGSPRS